MAGTDQEVPLPSSSIIDERGTTIAYEYCMLLLLRHDN